MTRMQSKRIKMDKLLTAVLDAHGGLENWAKTTRITARISCRLGYPIMMHVATSSSGMSLTISPRALRETMCSTTLRSLVDETVSLHLVCIGKTSWLSLPAKAVAIPVAVSAFPDEIYAAPRSRAERAYPKLTHYNKLDSRTLCSMGTAEIFSEEVRAGFRPLGK
jgi:hypothetical protein